MRFGVWRCWLGAAGVLSIVLLSGCTPEPKVRPASAPATQAVSWDGTYRGAIQITALGSGIQRGWCETTPQIVLQVTDNSFSYAQPHPNAPGNPTPVYSVKIAPDGTFVAQRTSGTMSGRIIDGHMAGTVDGSVCGYSFSADRS